jgi:hypothetical protein
VFEVQHQEDSRVFQIKVWSRIFGPDRQEKITQ